MSVLKTLTINGTTYNVTPIVPASSVTLLANAWTGEGDLHSQVVEIPEVTHRTKVDLQPTSEQLEEFHYKVLAFVAENVEGVVTVYAIGDRPTGDHTIQITMTEVEGTGRIRGNTVGTTMPRPDWNQTDPRKADYIANKPDVVGQKTPNDGEIFNDYSGNSALSANTHAEGQETLAGIKGFNIISVDTEKLLITVDDANLEEKAFLSYTIDDILQFDASKHHYNKLKIVSLGLKDGQSVIGIEKLTDEELDLSLDSDPNENYVWVVGKNFGKPLPMAYGSHAEGELTIAMGRAVHAEGRQTQAIGNYAHAEGRETVALYGAHAEGLRTNATGYQSHAEGSQTNSTGACSHAEGFQSKSVGDYSHAEGHQSQAIKNYSHAGGLGTITSAEAQTVIGKYNKEDASALFVVGNGTGKASNKRSNAFTVDNSGNTKCAGDVEDGKGNRLSSLATISTTISSQIKNVENKIVGQKTPDIKGAEIFNDYTNNIATHTYSHAEGHKTQALNIYSHAEGQGTVTEGIASHAEGFQTYATGDYAHTEGLSDKIDGTRYHVKAEGIASHAEGRSTQALGNYSHAGGTRTIADQENQTAIGQYNDNTTATNALFVVGNGTDEDNRSNAFTVNKDGTATAGSEPVKPMDLVTLQYVSGIKNELDTALRNTITTAQNAELIAKGRATGYVFDTVEDLDAWLADPANTEKLLLGDNLYIRATDVPDYWWDGEQKQRLETQKVDLSEYAKSEDLDAHTKRVDDLIASLATMAVEDTEYPGCYYRMVGEENEWLNPPMVIGEEYRTTERWNGKAVYTKLVDFGNLPNATEKWIAHNTTFTHLLRSHGEAGNTCFPRIGTSKFAYIALYVNDEAIGVHCEVNMSNFTATVQLWYIKD